MVSLGLANDGTRIRNSESGDTYADGSICDYYSVIEHAYISNQNDATSFLGWYDCIRTTYSRK